LEGGPRMIETGFWFIFFNLIIAYAWNLVRITWEWTNNQEEEGFIFLDFFTSKIF
jgi:hypothetical protein